MPPMKPFVLLVAGITLALTAAPIGRASQGPTETKKASAPATNGVTAKVEVVGLSLHKALEDQPPGQMIRFGEFLTDGTSVTLLVTHPGMTFMGIDTKKSHLESFTDDKNGDLLKPKPKPKSRGIVFFGNSSDDGSPFKAESRPDGHSILVKVVGPSLPTPGASKIALKGELIFNCTGQRRLSNTRISPCATVSKSAMKDSP